MSNQENALRIVARDEQFVHDVHEVVRWTVLDAVFVRQRIIPLSVRIEDGRFEAAAARLVEAGERVP
jgi:hypothetical protein